MTYDRRTKITFVIALGLHVGLVFAFGAKQPHLLRKTAQRPVETSIEIELGQESSSPAEASSPATAGAQLTASLRTRVHSVPVSSESVPLSSEPVPSEPVTSAEPPAPAPTKRLSLAELGVGAMPRVVGRGKPEKPPDPVAQAARSVEKSINDELARRDRELGLGSDGPLVRALERATYGSTLNGNGKATFVARIDSSGRVNLLQVLNVNGDHKGWSRVASQALRTLSRKKLRVPQGAKGIEFRISVESRWALPSGADPGLEVRMLGVPLKKGQGKRSARISILEPKAEVKMVDVPQPGGGTVRLPAPELGLGVLGVAGDASDIGAKARRIVHAKVESQKLL